MARSAPGPRKKRFPEAELLDRLRLYEAALRSYGADIDTINGTSRETKPDLNTDANHAKVEDTAHGYPSLSNDVEGTAQMLQGSSDDESETTEGPIFTTYDSVFAPDGMLGTGADFFMDLENLHPPPVHIIQLWQIYLDNVHPLLRCLHAPTVQQKLLKGVNAISTMPLSMHVLLFGIYSSAVASMRVAVCLDTFGEDQYVLTCRYTAATRYVLKKIGFLRTTDITVQQAVVINLVSMTKTVDPRSLLCMTAITERNARRNGYHLNTSRQNVPVFETEMRRRLWWQITVLQARAAETAAAGPSALCWDWHTTLPRNVNECDIHPEMKMLPSEHVLPTDMIFCLVRYEVVGFLRDVWLGVQKKDADFCGSEFGHPSIPLVDKLNAINGLEIKLQAKYLQHCDSQTALHILARYYAVYTISKMKIAAYATAPQSEQHQEKLMQTCLDAIEAYIACWADSAIEKFLWFLATTVPFLAYVHLLFHLRLRPSGELADRAWAVVTTATDVDGRPRWTWGLNPSRDEPEDSAMQLALANLVVKAWEAREAALGGEYKYSTPTPALVIKMQDQLSRRGKMKENAKIPSQRSFANAAGQSQQLAGEDAILRASTGDASLPSPLQDMPMDYELPLFGSWDTMPSE